MNWKNTFAAGCVALVSSTQCHAYDSSGKYILLGVASESCGEYVGYRRKGEDNAFRGYITGYLTYVNINIPNTYDIRGGRDMDSLLLWVEKYCTDNPLEQFSDAVVALEQELTKVKHREKP